MTFFFCSPSPFDHYFFFLLFLSSPATTAFIMISSVFEQQKQAPVLAKRQKELERADTIKASYLDDEEGGKEEGAPPAAGEAPPLGPSGDLGLGPPPSSPSSPSSPAASAARLAALSAELERLQKNQAVLADALARGRAVIASSSASAASNSASSSASSSARHRLRRSTLGGALADPPLVDPSPGAQAAHKKELRRREARARGGAGSSRLVSGGLCGFDVAEDLLQVDFAAVADESSSTPTEFRAAAFDEPQPKQTLRSLRSQAAGLLPAGDPKLASFLKQLEAQQRLVLKMLLAERGGGDKAVLLSPLLKNPLARLAAAGMTVPDDEGTAASDSF